MQSPRLQTSPESLENPRLLNFDALSINSSDSEYDDNNNVFAPPRKLNSKFEPTNNNGNSYETIADSIFSANNNNNNSIFDDYYYDTEIESLPASSSNLDSPKPMKSVDVITSSNATSVPLYEVKYRNERDFEVSAKNSLAEDCKSDCYSFIMDLIVDYDEDIASIISGTSSTRLRINQEDLRPTIDSILNNKPQVISSSLQQPPSPVKVASPIRTHQKKLPPTNISVKDHQQPMTRRADAYPKSISKTPTSAHHPPPPPAAFKLSSMQSGQYKNDFTISASELEAHKAQSDDSVPKKKTLKYRVVVTRRNIINNVKRLSMKSLSRKSVYGGPKTPMLDDYDKRKSFLNNNKLVNVIKSVINKVNSPIDNERVSHGPTVFGRPSSLKETSKAKLNRSKTHASFALTRLSGNYHRSSTFEFKRVQNKSKLANPLPRLDSDKPKVKSLSVNTSFNDHVGAIQRTPMNNIQIKKRSVLIKDNATDLYNLYSFDNPYADDEDSNATSQRMSLVMNGIKINNDDDLLGSNTGVTQIDLARNSTLVKNDNDTYIIKYDIIESPVSARATSRSLKAIKENDSDRTRASSRKSNKTPSTSMHTPYSHNASMKPSSAHSRLQKRNSLSRYSRKQGGHKTPHHSQSLPRSKMPTKSPLPAYKASQLKMSASLKKKLPNPQSRRLSSGHRYRSTTKQYSNRSGRKNPYQNNGDSSTIMHQKLENRKFFYA